MDRLAVEPASASARNTSHIITQAAMERLLARFASKAGKIRARRISLHSIPRDCRGQAAMERLLARFASKAGKIRARRISLHSIPRDCRGQAAMEFLLTYGWAILVVLVAISALAYFGVLNPASWLVTNQCYLPQGLSCMDHSIKYIDPPSYLPPGSLGSNTLEINFKNYNGYEIKIEGIGVQRFNDKFQPFAIILKSNQKTGTTKPPVPNIEVTNLNNGLTPLSKGDLYTIEFYLHYTNTEADLPHVVKGEITGKVE